MKFYNNDKPPKKKRKRHPNFTPKRKPTSRRKVKKWARRSIEAYGMKIVKKDGDTWYVTHHPNFWCMRWYFIVIYNECKLTGEDSETWYHRTIPERAAKK